MMYEDIISDAAHHLGYPKKFVDKVYRAYWRSVREYVSSLPLKQDLSDEEFLQLRPNVNVPSIGKLHVTLERYHGMKKRIEYFKNLSKKTDATYQED